MRKTDLAGKIIPYLLWGVKNVLPRNETPKGHQFSSIQFSHSVVSDCNPMDCSTPGLPVHHQLPDLAQSHVHWVSDAIQPSHPLSSSPSPPTFNLSQHQGLFKWVSSSHQVAKVFGASVSASVLPMNIQDWFPLGLTGGISLQSEGLSRFFSNTTVQKHQFFSPHLSWYKRPIEAVCFLLVAYSTCFIYLLLFLNHTRQLLLWKYSSPERCGLKW